MSVYPCKNPSCRSYGTPHPNCKCYGGMAEGGEVDPYCSKEQGHIEGCEYYKEGGEVAEPADFIPDAEFKPDEAPTTTESADFIPDDKFQPDDEKYSTPGQQALTAVEGLAQGFAGPVATVAEMGLSKLGVPGLSPEEIKGRQAENPTIHGATKVAGLGAGLFTGVGELGLIAKAMGGATGAAKLGGAAIKGALEAGLLQAGDEASKAMLGQDPEEAAAGYITNIGAAALLGGVVGGGFAIGRKALNQTLETTGAAKKLEEIVGNDFNAKVKSFLAGLGSASKGLKPDDINKFAGASKFLDETVHEPAFNMGMKAYNALMDKGVGYVAKGVGGVKGGVPGYEAGKAATPFIRKILGNQSNKYTEAALLKVMSTGAVDGAAEAVNYATKVLRGTNAIDNGIRSIFTQGAREVMIPMLEKDREKLRSFVEDGDMNQSVMDMNAQKDAAQDQNYASGGEVMQPPMQKDPIAQHFPEQNMALQIARGRINNYLNSVRPQPPPSKLPFDRDIPNPEKKRKYDKVLDLANKPLSILNQVKNGTLNPDTMKHFTQLYPELYGQLGKRITAEITKRQVNKDQIPYKMRSSLSMFLGVPLDSSFTPQSIYAAQSVFAKQSAAKQQQAAPPASKTSGLNKMASSHKTASQSLEVRNQRDH